MMSLLCCCYQPEPEPKTSNENRHAWTKHNRVQTISIATDKDATTTASTLTSPLMQENTSKLDTVTDDVSTTDFEDLQHIARKREIRITVRRGTQAGVAAGLSVMAGVIIAGPVGALVGGIAGTAMAHRMSLNVVSLNDLLIATPASKRHEILKVFSESFKEEFLDTIQNNPEVRLLMNGASIIGIVRYMVDREMLQNEQLTKVDTILKKIKMY